MAVPDADYVAERERLTKVVADRLWDAFMAYPTSNPNYWAGVAIEALRLDGAILNDGPRSGE